MGFDHDGVSNAAPEIGPKQVDANSGITKAGNVQLSFDKLSSLSTAASLFTLITINVIK